ncbi:MAG: thiamine pyrophosphate-binding protein, partial [Burkholderiales bacterium]
MSAIITPVLLVGARVESREARTPGDAADLVVRYLERIGVQYVFGIPGGAIEPLYNALARSERRGGLRAVVARHEAGAAFMADGYARETGKLGVCCSTTGPGATNMITGVACAYENEIPMLVLTAQTALPTFGKHAFQESSCTGVNTVGMFQHCTRYNSLVSHADQLEQKLITAMMMAHGSPCGPAHLSIPLDVLRASRESVDLAFDPHMFLQRRALSDEPAIREFWRQIKLARQVVIVIGGGCGEAIGSILEFALQQNAAVVTTPDGKGLVSSHHPLFKGVFGFAGHQNAYATVADKSVDLVIAIGTRLSEWVSGGWDPALLNDRLVHVDSSEEHLAASPMARMHISGRILNVFEKLLQLHYAKLHGPYRLGIEGQEPRSRTATDAVQVEELHQCTLDEPEKYADDAIPIKPQRLMAELSRIFPPSTRYFADTGNSVAWATHYLHPLDRRVGGHRPASGGVTRLVMDFAPMGWAIGGAVGAALATGNGPVVC